MFRPSYLVIALVLGSLSAVAAAEELSASKAKKMLKEAAALESRDAAKAAGLYQQIADQSAKTSERRADALYALALLQIQRADHDYAAAGQAAKQMVDGFPRDPRRAVARSLVALIDALAAEKSANAERDAKLAAAKAAADQLKAEQEAAMAAGKTQSTQKVDELEARLKKLRAELEAAKSELVKKEEALQKLKKVVAGGG